MASNNKSSKLITLKTFNTREEAELARGYLEANNIKSQVQADDEGGSAPFPFQPSITGVRLLINPNNLELAKKLVSEKHSTAKTGINKPLLAVLILFLIYYLYLFIKDL